MAPPPSERLRVTIGLAEPWLARATEAFWSRPGLVGRFPAFLLALHGSVRATVPLLEEAERQARRRSDPLSARLAPYYRRHAREEHGHEEWLLADLEALGWGRAAVQARLPPPAVAALVGAQYYWVRHAHPVALLGHFAVLEGFPPDPQHLEAVRARTGLPAEAFRMLHRHAEDDRRHGAEVFALLDALPLGEGHAALVGTSALHTMEALTGLFREILDPQPDDRGI